MWSRGYVCPNFMLSALSISLQVEETITIIKMMIQLYTLMLWWLNNSHGCANTAILYKKNATATVKWSKFWIINMNLCMLICLYARKLSLSQNLSLCWMLCGLVIDMLFFIIHTARLTQSLRLNLLSCQIVKKQLSLITFHSLAKCISH